MNDFNLLIAQFNSSLPTLSDGEYQGVQVDSSGRLIISGRYLEDSAHSSGDAGLFMMAVRNDTEGSLVDTDGDYAPLQVDASGRLRVVADLEISNSAEKTEDSAHSSGDIGNFVLAVRQDTLAASVDTDGDYGAFKINSKGELYVHDTDVLAQLVTIDSVLDSILVDTGTIASDTTSIDSTLTGLSKAEDSAHSSTDSGIMALAVRNDTEGSLVDSDGDYASLQLDSLGRLRTIADVEIQPVGSEEYTVTDALAAAGDGLETITAAATPWVTVASFAHTSGIAYLYGFSWACDQNAQMRIVTDDTVDTKYYRTDINSSATPGTHEHFGEEGRIEIPGAANLEIRLQIKKRSSTGGDANGTGALHIRK